MLHFEVELEVAYELSSRLHYIIYLDYLFTLDYQILFFFYLVYVIRLKQQYFCLGTKVPRRSAGSSDGGGGTYIRARKRANYLIKKPK